MNLRGDLAEVHASNASSGPPRLPGKSGEVATDLRRIEGDKTSIPMSQETNRKQYYAREPSYTIVKSDGSVTAQGSFKYG